MWKKCQHDIVSLKVLADLAFARDGGGCLGGEDMVTIFTIGFVETRGNNEISVPDINYL